MWCVGVVVVVVWCSDGGVMVVVYMRLYAGIPCGGVFLLHALDVYVLCVCNTWMRTVPAHIPPAHIPSQYTSPLNTHPLSYIPSHTSPLTPLTQVSWPWFVGAFLIGLACGGVGLMGTMGDPDKAPTWSLGTQFPIGMLFCMCF